ncbi:MAG TPA: protein kinase [Terriglobales bacterium]|nr:protein kinase [Terriglobales bacterium]
MIGQTLGHYRVVEQIGAGGMGVVYRARDERLDRDVALKVLPESMLEDAAALKSFRKEAHALSKLSHPNIATVHDFDVQDGVSFLVMEYIPGVTLDQMLSDGPLSEKEVLRLGVQLAQGLGAAHQEHLVHRDVKPSNLRVTPDGRLKILDFGLAKLVRTDQLDATESITGSNQVAGTLPYMSPEQLQGQPVDQRSDIYSAGAVLYQMGTGRRPFPETSVPLLIDSIVHKPPQPPSAINRKISAGLESVILKTLDKDPDHRYQSAKELQIDLERTGPVYVPPPQKQRSRRLGALSVIFVLAAATFAIVSLRPIVFHRAPEKYSPPAGVPSLDRGKFLAVIPFRVQDGKSQTLGPVAEGLSRQLSLKLLALHELTVTSSRAAGDLADLNASPSTIAHQLGVNLLLTGYVHGDIGKVVVSVKIADIWNNHDVWNREFPGIISDAQNLGEQIYDGLVKALQLHPSTEERAQASARLTYDADAYDSYSNGLNELQRKSPTAAFGFFNQAIRRDPHFALAYSGEADAFLMRWRETKDRSWADKALRAARQAQSEDDKSPSIHIALGNVYSEMGDTDEAIDQFKRASDLSTNSDAVWVLLGRAYMQAGGKDQEQLALTAFNNAVAINPEFWLNYNELGIAQIHYGEYDKAADSFRKVKELDPDNSIGYKNLGDALCDEADYWGCRKEEEIAVQMTPTADAYLSLGTAHFYLQQYPEAVISYVKSLGLNPNDYLTEIQLGDAYRLSGKNKLADENYEKAVQLASKELEGNPRNAEVLGNLARCYALLGRRELAIGTIGSARQYDPSSVDVMYDEAQVMAVLKNEEETLKSLRQACAHGSLPGQARLEPDFASFLEKPEFKRVLDECHK